MDKDPEDLAGAEELITKLEREIQETDNEIETTQGCNNGGVGPYSDRAEEMRRKEHYVNQISADKDSMTEFSAQRDADAVRELVCRGRHQLWHALDELKREQVLVRSRIHLDIEILISNFFEEKRNWYGMLGGAARADRHQAGGEGRRALPRGGDCGARDVCL